MVNTLRLDGVSKTYDDVVALAPLSVEVAQGEFVSLLGPSGCGKTTLLRAVAGLVTPDSGSITVGSTTFFDAAAKVELPSRRRNLSMVFQDLALWPHLRTSENVAFPLRARGRRKDLRAKVAAALQAVQLTDLADRYPHQLSGGQQQRVALARAIVDEPAVLLMDEPLSALDQALKDELRDEIKDLTRRLGLTTVFVTHDQGEAMSMSDRVLVLNRGRLMQDAAPEVLYRNPANPFVASFVGRYNRLDGYAETTDLVLSREAGLRPDRLRRQPRDGDLRYVGIATAVSFVGDRYEVRLRMEKSDTPWTFFSERHVAEGELVELFADPNDLTDPLAPPAAEAGRAVRQRPTDSRNTRART